MAEVHSSCTTLHPYQQGESVPSSPPPHQYLLFFFYYSHPNKCEVALHCWFDWGFPNADLEHLLMIFLYIIFGEMYIQAVCIFLIF